MIACAPSSQTDCSCLTISSSWCGFTHGKVVALEPQFRQQMYYFFPLATHWWGQSCALCRIFHIGRALEVVWKNMCVSYSLCFVFQSKEIGIQMHEELVKVTNELYTVSSPDPSLTPPLIPGVRRCCQFCIVFVFVVMRNGRWQSLYII